MSRELLENKEYHIAQKYLIFITDSALLARFIREWSLSGHPSEKDLFFTRFVLL